MGPRLRALREAKGWSQEELARRAGGLSSGTIRNIEKYGALPGTATALKLAEALGVSLDELLLGEKASA